MKVNNLQTPGGLEDATTGPSLNKPSFALRIGACAPFPSLVCLSPGQEKSEVTRQGGERGRS